MPKSASRRLIVVVAAVFLASAAIALRVQPPPGSAVRMRSASEFDWKPPNQLPPGAEYHLIREDPKTHGIEAIVRFPAGYRVPEHHHAGDETIVVLRGRLRVRAGELEKTLKPGDYAVLPAGTVHELQARTRWRETRFLATTNAPYDVKTAGTGSAER